MPRLHGRAARGLDGARHVHGRRDVEIRARDTQAVAFGLEQDGREDRVGALRRDRSERRRQRVREIGLLNAEFHGSGLLPHRGRRGGLEVVCGALEALPQGASGV